MDYPLPGSWQAIPDASVTDDFKTGFLPLMLYALANLSEAPRRGMQQYGAVIEVALAKGDKLDAALFMHEGVINKQIPCPEYQVACAMMNDVRQRTANDREVEKLNEAIKLGREGKPFEAGKVLLGISRNDLKAGHMLDIYFGNYAADLFASGASFTPEQWKRLSEMVMESYEKALRTNPWITGLYNDIAKFLLRKHQVYEAWLAWDIGRSLFGTEDGASINDVEALEKQLMQDVPWKFGLSN